MHYLYCLDQKISFFNDFCEVLEINSPFKTFYLTLRYIFPPQYLVHISELLGKCPPAVRPAIRSIQTFSGPINVRTPPISDYTTYEYRPALFPAQ